MTAVIAAAALVCLQPVDVAAQSFLQSLFGGGRPAPTRPATPVALPPPSRSPVVLPPAYRAPRPQGASVDRHDNRLPERGNQRTVCVRLCDGYYWPLSHAAGRGRIRREEDACRASCASEARLFHGGQTADVATLVDAGGRSYSALPTAYRYRRVLEQGCSCKPASACNAVAIVARA